MSITSRLNQLDILFAMAKQNPNAPMNRAGRLMGRHCRARLQRAVAKRVRRGKRAFTPAGPAYTLGS